MQTSGKCGIFMNFMDDFDGNFQKNRENNWISLDFERHVGKTSGQKRPEVEWISCGEPEKIRTQLK